MDNLKKTEIECLTERVEILERKLQRLSSLFLQIGKSIENEEDSLLFKNIEDKEPVKVNDRADEQHELKQAKPSEATPKEMAVSEDNDKPGDGETIVAVDAVLSENKQNDETYVARFIEKYASGNGEYDFYLDIGKDLIRELKRYVEWKQVPLTIKETLYLEEAYDSNMFYADGVQIGEEFFFFVAPAEPDMRYNKGDFVRLALPYFYDVSYLPDLNGKLLKLIQPAVLVSDDNGRFTLKEKGKIAIAR